MQSSDWTIFEILEMVTERQKMCDSFEEKQFGVFEQILQILPEPNPASNADGSH